MSDEPAEQPEPVVETTAVEDPPETAESVRAAVEDATAAAALTVRDPRDPHEGMVAMDAHDASRFLDNLVTQAQERNLGKRWVYQLPREGKPAGLTGDAVEDITQQMNWTGRARIHVDQGSLSVESIEADEGDGPEPFWIATVAASDDVSGSTYIGTSMEPQKLKLKESTARQRRTAGHRIPEDNRIFDRFARAKAINKAERNALEKHIPEIVKVTLIAMAKRDPSMIEHIETEAEVKQRELPPALDTPEAEALRGELRGIYAEIREAGGGKGRLLITPGRFHGALMHAQHSMESMESMKAWLLERRDSLKAVAS